MKKKILVALSYLLVVALAVTGTVAYLQDTDSDVNVMTLGNVKIEQIEQEWNEAKTELVDFTQAKPLYPYVGQLGWENETEEDGAYRRFTMNNVVDKYVSVKNTGKSDAYVRTFIALEMGDYAYNEFTMVGVSNNAANGAEFQFDGAWEWTNDFVAEIDGKNYNVMVAVHEDAVEPGETTIPSLLQVYLSKDAGNEEVEKLDGNDNGTYDILVFSEAVQTNGFTDAESALNEAFGNPDNSYHPWGDGADIPVIVDTADELVAALEAGNDVILTDDVKIDPAGMSNAYGTTGINVKNGQTIDGRGNTLDIKGAGGTWDSGINTTGGLIKDLTVTGSFRGIFINHNSDHSEPVVLDNVTIDGTTYTISCDQGLNQDFEATDSTFNGWTSYAATLGSAKFTNCSFGEGNGYAYCRPYAPTTFVNCEFEAGYTLDPRADIVLENCTFDGVALTSANIDQLVVDTSKVTVK